MIYFLTVINHYLIMVLTQTVHVWRLYLFSFLVYVITRDHLNELKTVIVSSEDGKETLCTFKVKVSMNVAFLLHQGLVVICVVLFLLYSLFTRIVTTIVMMKISN